MIMQLIKTRLSHLLSTVHIKHQVKLAGAATADDRLAIGDGFLAEGREESAALVDKDAMGK